LPDIQIQESEPLQVHLEKFASSFLFFS